jgi:hypothetical protein
MANTQTISRSILRQGVLFMTITEWNQRNQQRMLSQ